MRHLELNGYNTTSPLAVLTMHFVTKTTPFHNIDSKYHIKEPESCITYLLNRLFQVHFTRVAVNSLKTDTQTYTHTAESNFKNLGAGG